LSNRGLLKNLVNFVLIESNCRLLLTADNLPEVEAVKKEFEQTDPEVIYVIQNFSVKPGCKTKYDARVTQYEKIAGFSLWQQLEK